MTLRLIILIFLLFFLYPGRCLDVIRGCGQIKSTIEYIVVDEGSQLDRDMGCKGVSFVKINGQKLNGLCYEDM